MEAHAQLLEMTPTRAVVWRGLKETAARQVG